MERINTRQQLVALAQRLGVRRDWHEPDEQKITAKTDGVSFDNAGFWPREQVWPGLSEESIEQHVIISQSGQPVAVVNLATLFAWATGYDES